MDLYFSDNYEFDGDDLAALLEDYELPPDASIEGDPCSIPVEEQERPAKRCSKVPPKANRVVAKATGKHFKIMTPQRQLYSSSLPVLPLEEHHVVLKEGSKRFTAATEIYGDHVQCIFGRATRLSGSQIRHLKALQDAYNCCKLAGSSSSSSSSDKKDPPLPPVSFWIRKEKAEKQATKKGKLNDWAQDDRDGEVRYGFVQNKQVYFVRASDDCLRHDIRHSGDPMRGAHRQFKKLMKLFSAVPEKAPSSNNTNQSHMREVFTSCKSLSKSDLGKVVSTPNNTKSTEKEIRIPKQSMPPALSPVSTNDESAAVADSSIGNKAIHPSSPPLPLRMPPPTLPSQHQELFHINRFDNLEQKVNDICKQWMDGSTGLDRIIKEGLVKSYKEDVAHFQSQGLVDAIVDMKVHVVNSFGNNMILCYQRLPVKPLAGQKSSKMFQLASVENLEEKAMAVCKHLINNSSGMNRALRRGLVEAFKEDIQHFQTRGLLVVDNSILFDVINFFGNRMANYCDTECLDLSETLGMLSS